jgi:hypothetical protein
MDKELRRCLGLLMKLVGHMILVGCSTIGLMMVYGFEKVVGILAVSLILIMFGEYWYWTNGRIYG